MARTMRFRSTLLLLGLLLSCASGAGEHSEEWWMKQLAREDYQSGVRARNTLSWGAPGATTVLAHALGSDDPVVRRNAASVLAGIYQPYRFRRDGTLRKALRAALDDPDRTVRTLSAVAMAAIYREEADADAVRPVLMATVTDEPDDDPEGLREDALDALRWLGPGAAPAFPTLLGLLGRGESYDDWKLGDASLDAYSTFKRLGRDAVPFLLESLRDRDVPKVARCRILQALGDMEIEGLRGVPAMIRTLSDTDEDTAVRTSAAAAIASTRGIAFPALPALEKVRPEATGAFRKEVDHAIRSIEWYVVHRPRVEEGQGRWWERTLDFYAREAPDPVRKAAKAVLERFDLAGEFPEEPR